MSLLYSVVYSLVAKSCLTLWDPMDCSLCPWDSPGQGTGVGSHSLLQRIFPTQWLNPGLLHCRQILYRLSHQGSPKAVKGTSQGTNMGNRVKRGPPRKKHNWKRAPQPKTEVQTREGSPRVYRGASARTDPQLATRKLPTREPLWLAGGWAPPGLPYAAHGCALGELHTGTRKSIPFLCCALQCTSSVLYLQSLTSRQLREEKYLQVKAPVSPSWANNGGFGGERQ